MVRCRYRLGGLLLGCDDATRRGEMQCAYITYLVRSCDDDEHVNDDDDDGGEEDDDDDAKKVPRFGHSLLLGFHFKLSTISIP